MARSDRQEFILNLLKMNAHVDVDNLSSSLSVTTQTIRRDLTELCRRGLAIRIHGGARRLISTSAIAYEERRLAQMHAKQAIANIVAELVPDGASVILNIGTTTEQVAAALRYHKGLTVLTTSINIVHALKEARLEKLIIIGGEVRRSDGAVIGENAIQAISHYKADFAIIGASALDEDGSVFDFDINEVAVSRAILNNARTRILVADNSKFSFSAIHRICQLDQLDYVITNEMPPPRFSRAAAAAGTRILISSDAI